MFLDILINIIVKSILGDIMAIIIKTFLIFLSFFVNFLRYIIFKTKYVIQKLMGYSDRNPIFSWRLGEYRHAKVLRLAKLNKMPANDFLRSIVDQYLAGDLIPKAKDDLAVEMQKLKW